MSDDSRNITPNALVCVAQVCVETTTEWDDDVPKHARALLTAHELEPALKYNPKALASKIIDEMENSKDVDVYIEKNSPFGAIIYMQDDDDGEWKEYQCFNWNSAWVSESSESYIRADGNGANWHCYWTVFKEF